MDAQEKKMLQRVCNFLKREADKKMSMSQPVGDGKRTLTHVECWHKSKALRFAYLKLTKVRDEQWELTDDGEIITPLQKEREQMERELCEN